LTPPRKRKGERRVRCTESSPQLVAPMSCIQQTTPIRTRQNYSNTYVYSFSWYSITVETSRSNFPNYYISKLRLEALLGIATAPRYTPGGFPITLNTRSDNRSDNATDNRSDEQPGQRITIENADEHLYWLPEHSVIVCSVHKYAIRNVATHLRDSYYGTKKQRQAVVDAYSKFVICDPKNVPLPSLLRSPLSILSKPLLVFICEELECERISISRDEIRKHYNRTHDWKSSKED
jgi:hypothetical protein